MTVAANLQLQCRLSSALRIVVSNDRKRWMSSVKVLDTTDAVTKFRVDNPKSVLYFTATWCPPCKMIAPIYTSLAETYPTVAFGKIDIDSNQVRSKSSLSVTNISMFFHAQNTFLFGL